MRNAILVLLMLTAISTSAFAQEKQGSAYLKTSFVKTEGRVEDVPYGVNSLAIEIESYFSQDKVFLSGWSVAYRKEDIRFIHAGHYFSLKTFHNFDVRLLEIKLSIGEEWGYPSLASEKTVPGADPGQLESYRHIFLIRNSKVPFFGTEHDGVLYPFLTLSFTRKIGIFMFEGGARMDFGKFGLDAYDPNGQFSLNEKWVASPSVFVGFGLKIH